MANNNDKIAELLKKALALLGAEGEAETEVASRASALPDSVDDLPTDKGELKELAKALGIETDGLATSAIKALLSLAVQIKAGETEDADPDDVVTLCETVGLQVAKKMEKNIEALTEYFSEEGPAKEADGDGDEDDEDDEKPKAGLKKLGKTQAEADDEEPEDAAEWIELYNAAAPKKAQIETWEELSELLKDDEGAVADWGTGYVKDGEAFCCGLKMEDVEDEEETCVCAVTGKKFTLSNGELVEKVEKKAKKLGKG